MSTSNQDPGSGPKPATNDDLRPVLERIASALEQGNEASKKKEGEGDDKKKEGGGRRQGQEGGRRQRRRRQGQEGERQRQKGRRQGPEGRQAKRFFLSPLGIILVLVVLTILVIAGIAIAHYESTHESTDDAYTTAHVHQISPRVSGLVLEVWVDDNQAVKSGDLLVKLDPRDYEVSLQRAQANLDQANAQVLQAQAAVTQAHANSDQAAAQVTQARAQTAQAGARYEVAGIDYGRNKSLSSKDSRAVSQSDVDTTKSTLDANRAAFDAAKANVEAAEAMAAAAKSMIESREAELVVAKAAVETNDANVADAKLQLSYCWVLSPCDGRVSRKTVETGLRASAGQSILAVTENDVWVLANFKETQLAKVRVGQRVTLPVDAFKKHPFTGRVDSIQAGSGATYALLPPDNATGNFTKIVQRVPVKLTFDRDSIKGFEDLIVPGLSVVPVIDLSTTSDRGDHVTKDNPAPPKGPHQQ